MTLALLIGIFYTGAASAVTMSDIKTNVKNNAGSMETAIKTEGYSGTYNGSYRGALSSWAEGEVAAAINIGLVPNDLQDYFTTYISREEFTELAVQTVKRMSGMNDSTLRMYVGPDDYYPDTSNSTVEIASALGIIKGYTDGTFGPNKELTRQEAAAMLGRMATILGYNTAQSSGSLSFNDIGNAWGKAEIQAVSSMINPYNNTRVMQGTSSSSFSPNQVYSIEQAIVTMFRLAGSVTSNVLNSGTVSTGNLDENLTGYWYSEFYELGNTQMIGLAVNDIGQAYYFAAPMNAGPLIAVEGNYTVPSSGKLRLTGYDSVTRGNYDQTFSYSISGNTLHINYNDGSSAKLTKTTPDGNIPFEIYTKTQNTQVSTTENSSPKDTTGFTPKDFKWDDLSGYADQDIDDAYFRNGKWVRWDGASVLYIDHSSSPDFFEIEMYSAAASGKSATTTTGYAEVEMSDTKLATYLGGANAQISLKYVSNGVIEVTSNPFWQVNHESSSLPDGYYYITRAKNNETPKPSIPSNNPYKGTTNSNANTSSNQYPLSGYWYGERYDSSIGNTIITGLALNSKGEAYFFEAYMNSDGYSIEGKYTIPSSGKIRITGKTIELGVGEVDDEITVSYTLSGSKMTITYSNGQKVTLTQTTPGSNFPISID